VKLSNTQFSQFSCYFVRSEIIALVTIKNTVLWDVTPSSLVMSEKGAALRFTVRSARKILSTDFM
jgi:hypothetical protein